MVIIQESEVFYLDVEKMVFHCYFVNILVFLIVGEKSN